MELMGQTIPLPQSTTQWVLDANARHALLCVHQVGKTFHGAEAPVIEDVTFCVHAGEVFVLVGPSGCGKTTTLRVIGGFERADRGEVLHDGRLLQGGDVFVRPEKRGIGFVFQDYALFPHLSVIGNVAYGVRGVPRRQRLQAAREALEMVDLRGVDERMPHDLSGGQQQRVALARAVAAGSKVVLLDEPFSNLDPDLRHATRSELRMLAERGGLAIVLVTHDQEEALSTADRLAVMREGRVQQLGHPETVYNKPRTAFVAQFLGRTNLIAVDADGSAGTSALGLLKLDRTAHGAVTVSLRPEHLHLEAADNDGDSPAGVVTAREFKGHDLTYRVRLDQAEYAVQTDHRARFSVGDRVLIRPDTAAAVVEAD